MGYEVLTWFLWLIRQNQEANEVEYVIISFVIKSVFLLFQTKTPSRIESKQAQSSGLP